MTPDDQMHHMFSRVLDRIYSLGAKPTGDSALMTLTLIRNDLERMRDELEAEARENELAEAADHAYDAARDEGI